MQQTRIWWMEVLRGIVALAIGILFLTIHVRFFIYALGIYLIFDGALDTYKVVRGKRVAKHKVLSILGSALTIVLGLLCFVSYIATLLIILLIIVVYSSSLSSAFSSDASEPFSRHGALRVTMRA